MRGWVSLFTKEKDLAQYRTGIFVASAEADVLVRVLPELPARFPRTTFTFLVPLRHAGLFQFPGEVLWLDHMKAGRARALRDLREKRFELCVVLSTTRPTYQKTRLAALLLNTRRTVLYNEEADLLLLDRAHWKFMVKHALRPWTRLRNRLLFFPFGFAYLLAHTWWLNRRAAACNRGGQGL